MQSVGPGKLAIPNKEARSPLIPRLSYSVRAFVRLQIRFPAYRITTKYTGNIKSPKHLFKNPWKQLGVFFLRETAKKRFGIATYFHHCSTPACLTSRCIVCSSSPSLQRLSFIKCNNHFLLLTENNKREQTVFRLVLFVFKHTHKKSGKR